MMSERKIAESFNSIWKATFPMLTSNYVRVFNGTRVQKTNSKSIYKKENLRFDLVSELSFLIVKYSFQHKLNINDVLQNQSLISLLTKETALRIWNIEHIHPSLSEVEMLDVKDLVKATADFIEKRKPNKIIFEPILKGYGIIPDLTADLAIDDTLFEIKTVKRNFRSADIKQLLLYLALNELSEKPNKWLYGGLYNPRKSVYAIMNIESFVYSISGGNSVLEAFTSLVNSFTRDIQIDQKF